VTKLTGVVASTLVNSEMLIPAPICVDDAVTVTDVPLGVPVPVNTVTRYWFEPDWTVFVARWTQVIPSPETVGVTDVPVVACTVRTVRNTVVPVAGVVTDENTNEVPSVEFHVEPPNAADLSARENAGSVDPGFPPALGVLVGHDPNVPASYGVRSTYIPRAPIVFTAAATRLM
jgi:hypothetical protein